MNDLTMQALDCINNEREFDLTLLDSPIVRDNMLVLLARDFDTPERVFAHNLMTSLSKAMESFMGELPVGEKHVVDRHIFEKLSAADDEIPHRIGVLTDLSMAVYFLSQDLSGIMSTWGFRCTFHLPLSSVGSIVLHCIDAGMPTEVLGEFLKQQDIQVDEDSKVDWGNLDWGSQTP